MGDGPAGTATTVIRLIAVLGIAAGVLIVGDAGAASMADRDSVRRIVVQEALASHRVPPSLALAVAEAESDFAVDAESPAGARGVMQIMPATGRGEFGVKPEALWDPRLNARVGVAFLDQLIERYGERWDLALSHYNGGSRVGAGADARVIPETRAYVDKVLHLERRNARDQAVAQLVATEQRLFAAAAAAAVEPLLSPVARSTVVPSPIGGAEVSVRGDSDAAGRRRAEPRLRSAPVEARLNVAAVGPRWRRRAVDSAELLGWIEARKQRFRALLVSRRDG